MTSQRPPAGDRDEPPFVLGLLIGAFARLEDGFRRAVTSLDVNARLLLWAAASAAAFVLVLLLSIAESPTLGGIARGVAAGLFTALLVAAGCGWILLFTVRPRGRGPVEKTKAASGLETLLGPTLAELRAVRAEVIARVKIRSAVWVPIGLAAAFGVWVLGRAGDDPPGAFELVGWLVGGALGGEAWAAWKLDRDYRRLYKDRVLPLLAARFGDLTYRRASRDEVERLRVHRILPDFDTVQAEDEIAGTHRGLAIEIVEALLRARSGKKSRTVFDGLLVGLTLPRALTGTTVVLGDEGVFGNLQARWRAGALEPVRLEDPRFEERFEVYGNDQVEARALLTPAFMERFMALAAGTGFSLPGALAEGNRLVVALPKRLGGDLFEPPVYWKPVGGEALVKLEEDIRAVLGMADAVIDLDFWAAGRKRDVILGS